MGVALSQSRSLTRGDEASELVGSRAPPKIPERQRGLWSFLTWSFVIAPIVAAEAFFAKNASALSASSDDQSQYANVAHKAPADAAPDHDPTALAGAVLDDSQQPDDSRLSGFALAVSHSRNTSHDGGAGHWEFGGADAGSSPAGVAGGGGGGGGGGSPSPSPSGLDDATAAADNVANFQDVDAHANDKQGGSIEQNLSAGEITNGPMSGATVGAMGSDVLPNISPRQEHVLASTTSEVISTISPSALPVNVISIAASALSGIVSPIDLDSTQNLKDVVGFDLHVNGVGEYVANDLSTALELNPSQLVADVSTSTGSAIDDLPRLELGAAGTLNNLLGKGLLDVDHLSDLISEPGSVVATSGVGGDLGSAAVASLEKVAAPALSTLSDGVSNASLFRTLSLPTVSTVCLTPRVWSTVCM